MGRSTKRPKRAAATCSDFHRKAVGKTHKLLSRRSLATWLSLQVVFSNDKLNIFTEI